VAARLLIIVVALVLALPAALFAASMMTVSLDVSAASYVRMLVVFVPLALIAGAWVAHQQSILLEKEAATFIFTRYAMPKRERVRYESVSQATYVPGKLRGDNRPRPLLEFSLRSGRTFWIPLAIYQKRQIEELLTRLREHGVDLRTATRPS
jgi:hypothetical protein